MALPSGLAAVRSPAPVNPPSSAPLRPGAPAVNPIGEVEVVPPVGAEPPSTLLGSVAAGMALLVAPSIGRFRPFVDEGPVAPGAVIAVVSGGGGRADEVRVPVAAEVHGLLALDGQIVQSGQALAWIRRLEV